MPVVANMIHLGSYISNAWAKLNETGLQNSIESISDGYKKAAPNVEAARQMHEAMCQIQKVLQLLKGSCKN